MSRWNSTGDQNNPMGGASAGERSPEEAARRGLLKLMIRLPALRGRLQLLAAKGLSLNSLCEAYDDATEMLDGLRKGRLSPDRTLIDEYENLSSDIETDVIRYCLLHGASVP